MRVMLSAVRFSSKLLSVKSVNSVRVIDALFQYTVSFQSVTQGDELMKSKMFYGHSDVSASVFFTHGKT